MNRHTSGSKGSAHDRQRLLTTTETINKSSDSNDVRVTLQNLSCTVQHKQEHQPSKKDEEEEHCYHLYPQRHLVLLSFSILSLVNSWIWITWSPLTTILTSYWSLPSSSSIDELSSVYMYIYIPLSFPALHFLNKLKLRRGLLVGGVLNAIGSMVRFMGIQAYEWVYVGTVFCAVAQTFTLSVPPLISGSWYGAQERGLATSVGVVANQIGSALGMSGTLFLNLTTLRQQSHYENEEGEEKMVGEEVNEKALRMYMGIQMIISIAAVVLIYMFVENHPPTPPSKAIAHVEWDDDGDDEENVKTIIGEFHDEEKKTTRKDVQYKASTYACSITTSFSSCYDSVQHTPPLQPKHPHYHHHKHTPTYLSSILKLLTSKSGLLLTIFYGLVVGVFYAIETFLSQFILWKPDEQLHDEWTSRQAGLLGLVLVIMGCVGSLISGYELDRQLQQEQVQHQEEERKQASKHKEITTLLTIGSILSMIGFTITVLHGGGSAHKYAVYTMVSSLGFFLSAVTSIGFEYASAITYPADEAAVAGILNVAAQIGGWILLIVGGKLGSENDDGSGNNNVSENGGGGVGVEFNIVLVGTLVCSFIMLMGGVTDRSQRPEH